MAALGHRRLARVRFRSLRRTIPRPMRISRRARWISSITHIDDAIYEAGWDVIHDRLDVRSFDLGVGHSKQAREFYEPGLRGDGDFPYPTVNVWPAVDGSRVYRPPVCPVTFAERDLVALQSQPARSAMDPSRSPTSMTSVRARVHVDDFTGEARGGTFPAYGRRRVPVQVQPGARVARRRGCGRGISPRPLREGAHLQGTLPRSATRSSICAKAQAAQAKSATAEGDAGGQSSSAPWPTPRPSGTVNAQNQTI